MDLLNIPAALTYPQWGQQAGQNIRQNALYQQARADQQAALARQSEQQQYERGLVAQKLTQEQHDALVNQFAGALVNSQNPAADYGPLRARYLQTVQASHPELAAALSGEIPEQFTPDIVADARGHLGIKPPQPGAQDRPYWLNPDGTIDPQRFAAAKELATANTQLKIENPSPQSAGTPYYNFIPTSSGIAVGNARTGALNLGQVGGQPILPVAADVPLAGAKSQAEARGTEVGKAGAAQEKRSIGAGNVLSLLDEADKILPQSTGSGVGTLADRAAALVGQSTTGAEAGDRLKVIAGNLTLSQPRMEGPQSDADRLLYQQMAANVADTSIPIKRRQAAVRTLRALNEKYLLRGMDQGQNVPRGPSPAPRERPPLSAFQK